MLLIARAERDTEYNNYHPLVMFLHTSGRWSVVRRQVDVSTLFPHQENSSDSSPFTLQQVPAPPVAAVMPGGGAGRGGVWEQCSGGGAAGRIVAVSALSPGQQQDAAADYVARRLRQITPTWGHSDDGNMLTNSSLLAHVN